MLLTAPPHSRSARASERSMGCVGGGRSGRGERLLAPLRTRPRRPSTSSAMPRRAAVHARPDRAAAGVTTIATTSRGERRFVDALLAIRERPHATHAVTGWIGGAIDRVAPGATAFGHRDTAPPGSSAVGRGALEPRPTGVRRTRDETTPFATVHPSRPGWRAISSRCRADEVWGVWWRSSRLRPRRRLQRQRDRLAG
jgi:hypothetical protein